MTTTFETLGLCPELVQTVSELGYQEPTPIQVQAVPPLLEGRDIMGQAQTGTGKTAAFALPMLHTLDPQGDGIQGLVIAPTRELANQVAGAIHRYGRHCDVRVLPVYGGQSYARQISRLKRGVDIVVGTPGRMLDLVEKGLLDLSAVRFVVLDEADEMLSMGFIEDIESLLSQTPETRQTALFSATLPDPIRRLADRYMHTPEAITVNPQQLTVGNTEQRYYVVRESDKLAAIVRLLEMQDVDSALIFCRTRAGTAELAEALSARGFPAEALHGDLKQETRETILGRFRRGGRLRAGSVSLLVATDVAARGLDIEDISHVINYDLPVDPEYYVHRIGRTGRAGRAGVALSLVTPRERFRVHKIERYMRDTIAFARLPTAAQVLNHRDEQFLDQLADQFALGQFERERAMLAKLAATGCDPLDLAAAAVQLARAQERQRPVEDIAEMPAFSGDRADRRGRTRGGEPIRRGERGPRKGRAGRKERSQRKGSHEPNMVRLTMDMGKQDQVHPGEIVGAIAGTARIPGEAIGAIDIYARHTFVDVLKQHEAHVLHKMGGWKLRGRAVVLQRAQ
ncbi:MAG: DEAD/DEAH box helicase [Anaerolineae bacterium]|nr:DEAD/DEAH box helicase [Anaerolineae bacterium]